MAPSGTTNPMMTPAAGMIIPEQMMSQMDQMRDDMMRLWTGQPTHADLITMMSQMQTLLMVMSQQAGTLSPQDLQGLTNDMAQAIDDLARVMETHVQEETGLVPGAGASPTATAP